MKPLVMITLGGILFLLDAPCSRVATEPATTQSTTQPATQPGLATEYANLLRRAEKYNKRHPQQSAWSMSADHCLLVDDEDIPYILRREEDTTYLTLNHRIIAFVRRPGALDLIFTRLLDGNPDDEEILADAQMLVYAGSYVEICDGRERRDEVLPRSRRAGEVLDAAEKGRFISAERRWPDAPIREKIEKAARWAIAPTDASTPPDLLSNETHQTNKKRL
jgi:hypothetical protein